MLKLPRPERNGKHFVSYCNKRNKSDNDYSIAQAANRRPEYLGRGFGNF